MTQSQDQQETILHMAREMLPQTTDRGVFSLDRCRHESVEEITIWVFFKDKNLNKKSKPNQIGVIVSLDGANKWRASRISHGMPTSHQTGLTMAEALAHVTD